MNSAITLPAGSERRAGIRKLMRRAFAALGGSLIFFAVCFFVPAGTLDWWQAWAYIGILLVPMSFSLRYFFRADPELLDRRLRFREREKEQRKFQKYSYPVFFLAYLIPGFDRRFGWSSVPLEIVILSEILVLAGYVMVARVFMQNSFASRVIEVEKEQKLIDTGLYARIRHPMYAGVLVMYCFSPLALGSWPAAVVMLGIPIMLTMRIRNEEEVLLRELPGYREYMQRVRYRIIPGIW